MGTDNTKAIMTVANTRDAEGITMAFHHLLGAIATPRCYTTFNIPTNTPYVNWRKAHNVGVYCVIIMGVYCYNIC